MPAGKSGNQLKPDQRFQMQMYCHKHWDDPELNLKRKTQADIAAHLSEQFELTVTRQNVSSMLRTAGLVQAHGHTASMVTREVAISMSRMLVWLYDVLIMEDDLPVTPEVDGDLDTLKEFISPQETTGEPTPGESLQEVVDEMLPSDEELEGDA